MSSSSIPTKMADDGGATGSAPPPNNYPNESDSNLRISEVDCSEQQSPSLRKLGSNLPNGKRALLRSNSSVPAMCTGARRRRQFRRALKRVSLYRHEDEEVSLPSPKSGMKWRNQMDIDPSQGSRNLTMHGRLTVQAAKTKHNDVEQGKGEGPQYTLNVQSKKDMMACMLAMLGISGGRNGIYDDASGADKGCKCFGVSPNFLVLKYLHWSFRASFIKVTGSAALMFYVLTLLFAALILWSGRNRPDCIHVNGIPFGNSTYQFGDAFFLSWTTFTTTGYGTMFPSTSAVVDPGTRCIGIAILCALDAFVGILFGSFCLAIFFGKVSRLGTHAQVIFSDPLVVRYGRGLGEKVDDDESSSGGTDEEKFVEKKYLPCPVLEFRVINRLHSTDGGELMDATLNVVACIKEEQACGTIRNALEDRRRKPKSRDSGRNDFARQSIIPEQESIDYLDNGETLPHPSTINRKISFEEDPSCRLVPRQIFVKLEIDTPNHPLFRRTWHVSHKLDADSPILSSEARRRVRQNYGFWPEELNNYRDIKDNIHFDHIVVSLKGTSNAGANFVHAQQVYDYVDMRVGYRFANVLYRRLGNGSVRVDTTMINDVLEQFGGGGEPLVCNKRKRSYSSILAGA